MESIKRARHTEGKPLECIPRLARDRPVISDQPHLGPVWFVANYATLCLRLVVQIEELTLGRKVRQSVAS
jgi:hypothetical protein